MAKSSLWGAAKTETFLSVLQETGNVSAAARMAKVSRASAYERRRVDKDFKQAWAQALEGALDDLEEALRQRALEGTDKPIYYAGKRVGDIKSYNDNLGMFLLRARRKGVFGEVSGDADAKNGLDADSVRDKLLSKLEAVENKS